MMNSQLLFEQKLSRGKFVVYSSRPSFLVKTVKQIHSDIVLSENEIDEKNNYEADGIIGTSQIPLAVLTADCIPVLLIGKNSHAIIHAGWKGLQTKILNHPFLKEINPSHAFIGPHIRVSQYEVQEEFKKNFPSSHSFIKINNQLCFDLTKEVTTQLQNNFSHIKIEDCKICTFSDQRFSSFRRNQTPNRNWNIYIPEGE